MYFSLKYVKSIGTKPNSDSQSNLLNSDPNNKNQNLPINNQNVPLTYTKAHTPEIVDLPFTAPIYRKIIEPVEAPYPAMCITSHSKGCVCYTQQATVLTIPKPMCLSIVKNSFFKDWQTHDEQQPTAQIKPSQQSGLLRGDKPLDASSNLSNSIARISASASPSSSKL